MIGQCQETTGALFDVGVDVAFSETSLYVKTTQLQSCCTQQEAVLKATAVRSPLPVMLSILPCPPWLSTWGVWGQGVQGQGDPGRGVGGGGGGGGAGAGDISSTLPLLHYHMVLRPQGTSHNKGPRFVQLLSNIYGSFHVDDDVSFFLRRQQPFLTTSKNGLDRFFDAHQLGVRFDVDVKILLSLTSTATNAKTA